MICTTTPFLTATGAQAVTRAHHVFVCEYVTGGGLYREAIPAALAQEALLMRNAMLQGMLEMGIKISVVHDPRMPLPPAACDIYCLQAGDDPWQIWQQVIERTDMTWLVAPESGRALERLSAMVQAAGKHLLSSPDHAVALAASKFETYRRLQSSGLNVVATWRASTFFAQYTASQHTSPQHASLEANVSDAWVCKPDDGISCEDTALFHARDAMQAWLAAGRLGTHIVQPYIPGQSSSLSMLCRSGQAWLLSCNIQLIAAPDVLSDPTGASTTDASSFQFQGSVVNGMAQHWQAYAEIAAQVASAIPDLFGYVGVDLIMDEVGELHILEVNPRLTTSFAGIADAIGYNPACLLMDLLYNEHFTLPQGLQRNRIEIKLND